MYIVKSITDFTKTPFEAQIAQYLSRRLDSVTCVEKIKNKDFIIKNLKPLNDFVICSTQLCVSNIKRIS